MSGDATIPSRRSIQVRSWAILVGVAFLVALSCFWLLFGRVSEARGVQLQEMARSQRGSSRPRPS